MTRSPQLARHVETLLGAAVTDDDGRARLAEELLPGTYRLLFETGPWFAAAGRETFYPEAVVAFTHDKELPWLLPGSPPTHRRAEVLAISVVSFRHLRINAHRTRSLLSAHRTLWDDPDAFVPERFLGANRDAIPRFAYLPFGAGPRVCIGQSFSVQEAVIVLAHVVRAVRFRMPDDHPPMTPLHRVTLRPEHGLRMDATRRGQTPLSAARPRPSARAGG